MARFIFVYLHTLYIVYSAVLPALHVSSSRYISLSFAVSFAIWRASLAIGM